MGKPPRHARAARRARAREHDELVRDRERLFRIAEGGDRARPIVVESPAQVDVVAARARCPACDDELRLESHDADRDLRVARLRCPTCGVPRALYFRLAMPLPQ